MRDLMDLEDPDANQIREVYARYGLAMYHAQCVERQVGILLAACFNPNFLTSSPADRDSALDDEFAKTFGRLIARLRETVRVPPDLEQRMVAALEIRNLLAHEYFWERASRFLTASGRESMIQELTDFGSELHALDTTLTDIGGRWRREVGITDEMVEAALVELRRAGDV